MTEDETQASSTETETSGSAPNDSEGLPQDEGSGASTLEDVEAYWKKRQSNSDKAHAAERAVLAERLKALEGQPAEAGATGNDSQTQARIAAAEKRAEEAEARATAATLAAKYPRAVQAVGRASVVMDEAALASLNEQLDFEAKAPRITDKNNPARPVAGGQKPVEEMSLSERKAHFKTIPYNSGQ